MEAAVAQAFDATRGLEKLPVVSSNFLPQEFAGLGLTADESPRQAK